MRRRAGKRLVTHAASGWLLAWLVTATAAAVPLRTLLPFTDGAVIQRGVPVPVRGVAAPGAEVSIAFAGRTAAGRADETGRWRVELPPLPPGGPFPMTIESGGERVVVRDVVIGDVWLCSGQSNMEWTVADSMNAADEIAAARDWAVRHFEVPHSWAAEPAPELAGGAWEPADPEHAGGFTAVGWFFARELRPHAGVPIGLVNASWGGSRIEPWMSAASLGLDDGETAALLARERDYERSVLEAIRTRLGGLPEPEDEPEDGDPATGSAVWADPGLDESGWPRITVPAQWEREGWEGMDGVAWYRTAFELTAGDLRAARAAGARLGLGRIDDSDVAWVNGREVGRMELAWNHARVYDVPAEALLAGRNVVAVRVEDTGGGGGIWGLPEELFFEAGGASGGGRRIDLAGTWGFRPAAVRVDLDQRKSQVPTMLYNRMIHPLEDFPVRGVLWYQGESNTGDAFAYRELFRSLIEDWRRRRGDADLPFLFVQLAGYRAPDGEDWPLLRESQSAALALPATAQVVLLDAGDSDDVHPRDKQAVGRRLALAARKVAYGEELVHSGPVYRGYEIDGGRVLIDFDHVGGGLVAGRRAAVETAGTGEAAVLGGFAIAGADRRFVPAEAAIERTPEGDRVAVWSAEVPDPVAIRYGWADHPADADLYNREGLPAAPFRTDSW